MGIFKYAHLRAPKQIPHRCEIPQVQIQLPDPLTYSGTVAVQQKEKMQPDGDTALSQCDAELTHSQHPNLGTRPQAAAKYIFGIVPEYSEASRTQLGR